MATTTRSAQQQSLAYAMGKGGRRMPAWVDRDDALRAAYDDGRAHVSDEPAAAEAHPEPAASPASEPVKAAAPDPEPVAEPEPAGEEQLIPWAECKRIAREAGASGDDLPPMLAEDPRLRRIHKRARANADYCNPLVSR